MADAVIEHRQHQLGGWLIGPHGEDRRGQHVAHRSLQGEALCDDPRAQVVVGQDPELAFLEPDQHRAGAGLRPCCAPLAAATLRRHRSAAARAPAPPLAAAQGRIRQHAGCSPRPAAAISTASERRNEGPPDCSGRGPLRRRRARSRACPRRPSPPTRSADRRTSTPARTSHLPRAGPARDPARPVPRLPCESPGSRREGARPA